MFRLGCAAVMLACCVGLSGCGAAGSADLSAHSGAAQQMKAPKRTQADRILALVAITEVTGRKPFQFGGAR